MRKRGQIWVETVIYTLIALIMIGAVLGFVRPKIQEIQDKLTIDNTFEIMEEIDSTIKETTDGVAGNKRGLEIEIKKGILEIKPNDEIIIFTLEESRSTYSEPDKEITIGNIKVKTEKIGKLNTVVLTLDYKGKYNLVYSGTALTKSPTPYKLSILNKGSSEIEMSIS